MRIRMMLLAALTLAACHSKKADTTGGGTAGGDKLYDRLGQMDAINAVVKDFVEEQVAKDNRINARFINADVPRLETNLSDQICQATGGPCTYTGKNMKEAHTGMGITDADFNALVEDLKKSLAKFNVPQAEQDELIGALAKMHDDIVEKP